MGFHISINEVTAEDWIQLRKLVGFPDIDIVDAKKALNNSLCVIGIKTNDNILVGMLRIIGDEAYSFYLNDVIVRPGFQNIGIGTELVNAAIIYIKKKYCRNRMFAVSVFSNKNAQSFYEKLGFYVAKEIPMKIHVRGDKKGTRKDCIDE